MDRNASYCQDYLKQAKESKLERKFPYENFDVFCRNGKIHPETHMKRNPDQANKIEKKETKLEDLTHSDFKIYYKDMVIKTLTWWHTDRHTEQLNRMESPEKNPFIYSLMNFDKGAKMIQWGKNNLVLGKLDIHVQKNEV